MKGRILEGAWKLENCMHNGMLLPFYNMFNMLNLFLILLISFRQKCVS